MTAGGGRPCVVLLHGLGRTSRAMWPMARAARARGYRVLNLDYRSRRGDVGAHAAALAARLDADAPSGDLHFVTHSLGGIVLRRAAADGLLDPGRVRRAVMLAPPNRGSEVADLWWDDPILRRVGRPVMGPSLGELRTAAEASVHRLPPLPFPCGVIAGTRSTASLFARRFAGPNDGKVSVVRAAAEGMRELVQVPHGHTFIMAMPSVIALTFAFLERGTFAADARR